MRLVRSSILVAAAAVLAALPAAAQQPAAVPSDSILELASRSRIKGSMDAPVTIVELSDFQCPFCRDFTRGALPALDSAYVQTGKVRFVYLNYPLPSHTRAFAAAEAALCAGVQGRFWPMHDRLFAAQEEWGAADRPGERFAAYAAELGLDRASFADCTGGDLVAPLILGDAIQAAASGASATPTFIIDGTNVLSGAQPFSEFQRLIEEALARKQ